MRSRFDFTRYYIDGQLEAMSALHVGGGDGLAIDRQLLRDGAGCVVVPGTSLAGALRSRWVKMPRNSASSERDLWGGAGNDDQASRVVLDDAPVRTVPGSGATDTRTTTAIDDQARAAEPGLLFSTEVMPTGATYSFSAEVDVPIDAQPVHFCQMPHACAARIPASAHYPADLACYPPDVADLLTILRSGFQIGAGESTGLGWVRLRDTEVRSRARNSASDLLLFITDSLQKRALADDAPNPSTPELTLAWRPLGAILVADVPPGDALDTVPLVTQGPNDCCHLLLPGTSIKGAVRAHAEMILNTVLGRPQGTSPHAMIGYLFGESPGGGALGRRGALVFHDVHSRAGWTRDSWEGVINADKRAAQERTPIFERLDALVRCRCDQVLPDGAAVDTTAGAAAGAEAGAAARPSGAYARDFIVGDHIAVDRWTGGVKDSALFSVLEPCLTAQHDWQPIRVGYPAVLEEGPHTVLPGAEAPNDVGPIPSVGTARHLLRLILADMAEGKVPFGHAVTRGYGSVRMDIGDAWVERDRQPWSGWVSETDDRPSQEPEDQPAGATA